MRPCDWYGKCARALLGRCGPTPGRSQTQSASQRAAVHRAAYHQPVAVPAGSFQAGWPAGFQRVRPAELVSTVMLSFSLRSVSSRTEPTFAIDARAMEAEKVIWGSDLLISATRSNAESVLK